MSIQNVVSISGGKDSTAMALLAIEQNTENLHFVFCDTGHEHAQTYEYVNYLDGVLRDRCGVGITTVKADLSARVIAKRRTVAKKWKKDGVPRAQRLSAVQALKPTGNPFLDLCLWKGRFPSTRVRFCTTELKHNPINELIETLLDKGPIISWQGIRADESAARKDLPMYDVEFGGWEPEPYGHLIYRPIIDWTAADVFSFHDKHGVEPNPLYKQGMGRVGCMPCVNVRKAELSQIALRFPEEIARVAEWERIVSDASKRGSTTFLTSSNDPMSDTESADYTTDGIDSMVEWANTARGGRQYDLIASTADASVCHSVYGLCE